jgi:uncharacterized protein
VIDTTICVLAKPPLAGRVKTRLAADIGDSAAARLARAFLDDTCGGLRKALEWAAPALAIDGAPGVDVSGFELWPQGGGDLGARLESALRRALDRRPIAIAIGADTPDLPPALLAAARAALREADAVFAPSEDGGFSLIGVRSCPAGVLSKLPWSAPRTLEKTRRAFERRALRTATIGAWSDIDTLADLSRVRRRIAAGHSRAPATQRAADELLPVPRVSVVMPVVDEEQRISAQLDALIAEPRLHEIWVVDGGSRDRTLALARQRAGVGVLSAPRGRASQLNAGARAAGGDVLLFLHADVQLPESFLDWIALALRDPMVVMGAFRTFTLDERGQARWAPLLRLADVRSRTTSLPYGDQAPFVRRAAFSRVGGFPEQALMEDYELARRMKQIGSVRTLRESVRVSGRRFLARPFYYTTLVNLFPLLYRAGVPATLLARAYRDVR